MEGCGPLLFGWLPPLRRATDVRSEEPITAGESEERWTAEE
jgi:hypothetical protein